MILSFSTHINGKPTYFIEKIWEGLLRANAFNDEDESYKRYLRAHKQKFGKYWSFLPDEHPRLEFTKIHTLRLDPNHRWKKDSIIHMAVGVRTKNYFQFAPQIPCTRVDDVFISLPPRGGRMEVSIADKYLYYSDLNKLALNDGFKSFEDFEAYFQPQITKFGLSLRMIHWTDFKY